MGDDDWSEESDVEDEDAEGRTTGFLSHPLQILLAMMVLGSLGNSLDNSDGGSSSANSARYFENKS